MNGMHLGLPLLLCVFVAAQHFKADAQQRLDLRLRLGKALFRRAREINETAEVNDDKREDSEGDLTEQERERAQEVDTAEDIFVGSGNHVFESQGKSDASDSKGEDTSGDEDIASDDEAEDDRGSTSGDGDEGDEDDDDEKEKSNDDDDDDDNSIQRNSETTEEASSEGVDSSGSALMENESGSRRSHDTSGSGSGNEDQADSKSQESDQSESVESSTPELRTEGSSQDTSSGSGKDTNVFKKSDIEATSSGESEDEDESGSAEIIRKGIESLSKLLTPVASGYEFELFSGKAPKNDKESEAEGESEKGERNDSEVTHVKQCKRVCEDPMTYNECAVPRCDYKMGTIKDLCIYLCKHQTPVCRQECE